jgi:hypothetical protein
MQPSKIKILEVKECGTHSKSEHMHDQMRQRSAWSLIKKAKV